MAPAFEQKVISDFRKIATDIETYYNFINKVFTDSKEFDAAVAQIPKENICSSDAFIAAINQLINDLGKFTDDHNAFLKKKLLRYCTHAVTYITEHPLNNVYIIYATKILTKLVEYAESKPEKWTKIIVAPKKLSVNMFCNFSKKDAYGYPDLSCMGAHVIRILLMSKSPGIPITYCEGILLCPGCGYELVVLDQWVEPFSSCNYLEEVD